MAGSAEITYAVLRGVLAPRARPRPKSGLLNAMQSRRRCPVEPPEGHRMPPREGRLQKTSAVLRRDTVVRPQPFLTTAQLPGASSAVVPRGVLV